MIATRALPTCSLPAFGRMKDIVVKRNEPYGPQDGVCHTLNLHAGARGLAYAMIEIRNDLIDQLAGRNPGRNALPKFWERCPHRRRSARPREETCVEQ